VAGTPPIGEISVDGSYPSGQAWAIDIQRADIVGEPASRNVTVYVTCAIVD
jgi:hypothetical protein